MAVSSFIRGYFCHMWPVRSAEVTLLPFPGEIKRRMKVVMTDGQALGVAYAMWEWISASDAAEVRIWSHQSHAQFSMKDMRMTRGGSG